jgi:uncharacterized repeat protein (TIGR02059 family)
MKNVLTILLLFLCTTVGATTYYVSPTGSDSNNGSSSSPWKTLANACAKATVSGDIIHINAGTYPETQRSSLAVGVSIEGEGVTSLITSNISAEFAYTILLQSGSEGTNGNQHISNIKMSGGLVAFAAIGVNARSNVKIYNCTFENFFAQGVMFNGGSGYLSHAPGTFATGNEFHDNIVTNCSRYVTANDNGEGCLMIGGQSGMLIYNNTIVQTARGAGLNGYPIKYYSEGYNKGVKIYNNILTTAPAAGTEPTYSWGFIIESHNSLGGMEFYGNTCKGALDLCHPVTGTYPFAWDIHDNTLGFDTQSPGLDTEGDVGIRTEENFDRINIYRNHFKNLAMGIYVSCSTGYTMRDLYVYNNIFENLGNNLSGKGWAIRFTPYPMSDLSNTVTNWNIWNNVMVAGASNSTAYAIQLPYGIASNFSVRNNIIVGFDQGPVQKNNSGTVNNVSIENNIFFNNGNNNDPAGSSSYNTYTYQNNLKSDPLLMSSSNFHLQSSSPAIGKGINVGLTSDYEGNAWNNPPSIGAYETGSAPSNPVAPVYQSSVIENASPALLIMSYDLSLANIVPAASSFSVQVNSVNRPVSAVAINGAKVQLTLASPVIYGDVVTLSYASPGSNPLQSASGGIAAGISSKSVTNNCVSQIPQYVSSVIENATPLVLEMSYDLSLANIVPAASVFNVQVNSAGRTVNSVAIVGGKVRLTLSSAVVFGDIVTVAYTKPASNPLQTATGGVAASISTKSVTNNCLSPIPVYVGSVIENASPTLLDMTYNPALANIVPAVSAFNVKVNSTDRTVSSVTITGGKVRLTLISAVISGDIVTVSYTAPASNPLQTSSKGLAASISNQSVTNNCAATIPTYQSSVIENTTPTLLDMTYNQALANIVPAVSAFNVKVNSTDRTVSSVTITGSKVRLTLISAVISGDIVTVSYTAPASNPLQTSSKGLAASISNQPVTNNCAATIPTYQSSVIENATPTLLDISYDLSLANTVPAVSAFNVLVNSVSRTINSVAIVGGKVRLTLASAVVFSETVTVAYIKPATNPLQTASGGIAASFSTKTVTNNCVSPIPVHISSVVENTAPSLISMSYDLSLANIIPAASAFNVQVNSVRRTVSSVAITGGKVSLTLSSTIQPGDIVTLSYTRPASNPLQTASGGLAASFSAKSVTNNCVPPIPVYVGSAIENASPSILKMTYSISLSNVIPSLSAFSVLVNSLTRAINSIAIVGGNVQLTLASPVVYGDVVTITYTKPSGNSLQTVSGGMAASINSQPVTNNVGTLIPGYTGSVVENATPSLLVMSFDLSLANIIPATTAFSVMVNSVSRTVNAVVISGTSVRLTLASRIFQGDGVTISYSKPSTNPIQTTVGGMALNVSNLPVINNCINSAPTAAITSPVNNSSFPSPASILISATASDPDGTISIVEFYNGTTMIGSSTVAPYSFNWVDVAPGDYSLTVTATDNLNRKTTSPAISVSVENNQAVSNEAPVIQIYNPSKGNVYDPLTSITIDAIASDADGTISKVEFFNGSVKLVELNSPPYTYTWKDVPAGSYILTAIATDNKNASTVSAPVEFVIEAKIKTRANSENVNLYPNPNKGKFSVEFAIPLQSGTNEVIISDLSGKQVYNEPLSNEEVLKHFDLLDLKSGMYILMIKNKEILVTKKFIIE